MVYNSSLSSGHFDPIAIRRRRPRWRPRSGQRRGATALFRSALDKCLSLTLATHMVADLDKLSNVKAAQAFAILSRTHQFDSPQRSHQGPSLARRRVLLDDCKESSGVSLLGIDVRSKVCDVLIQWRTRQKVPWDERVGFQI